MKHLRCLGRLFFVSGVVLGIALHSLPRGIAYAQPRSEALPLADLHFHAERGLAPDAVLGAMDRAGVTWAGNGAKGPDGLWRPFVEAAPDRFLPFAGQGAIGARIQAQGEAAWTLESPEIIRYLESLEQGLRDGRFRGIGELFVNNQNSHGVFQSTRYPADSPLMRRLLTLAATYHAPLSVHMDSDPQSIEELERLLPIDRNGPVIWAHCGFWIEADQVRRLMNRHSNLFCELSHRDDRAYGPRFQPVAITGFWRRLKPDWKALLEHHSDRFLIGTDADDLGQFRAIIGFYRKVLSQLAPDAAKRIAHGNAVRLFRLSQ
ncbi:MAG: amidohydrolase family protein [Acidobacteria bacterium]|nr:amidohydrolase family protein [Acidobacteriota bacterium]